MRDTRQSYKLIFLVLLVAVLVASLALLFLRQNNEDTVVEENNQVIVQPTSTEEPQLTVAPVVSNLDKPWDLAFIGDEQFIFVERAGAINYFDGEKTRELLVPDDLNARGEAGLMGVEVDPRYQDNRFVYVCYATTDDVRVVRWQFQETLTDEKVIVDGMPVIPSGRHSGCRLAFDSQEVLWIGTGDAADESTPQNPQSLGGKILRVDREGNAVSGNLGQPFDSRIFSYGHRNTQGIAIAQNERFAGVSAEHGPDRDDEINLLSSGNFGWQPGEGYNEAAPMTDISRYPDAIEALWSSGKPTLAVAGATFVYGNEWKAMDGRLLVANLKTKHIRMFDVADDATLSNEVELFKDEFGRLRTIRQAPNGKLYITTDNGGGVDQILSITPS